MAAAGRAFWDVLRTVVNNLFCLRSPCDGNEYPDLLAIAPYTQPSLTRLHTDACTGQRQAQATHCSCQAEQPGTAGRRNPLGNGDLGPL
jgi:hypothetical protein